MSDWTEKARDAMKRRGMTCLQLARELGVNRTTVGRYLSGRSTPGAGTLRHIGNVLGLTLVEVAGAETAVAQEAELLAAFRRMTAAERTLLLHCLRDREHRVRNGPEGPDG